MACPNRVVESFLRTSCLSPRLGALGLAAVCVCAAGAPRALGQCSVYRLGIPDFDQRRSTLPNGGSMYCVPASGVNWLGYIANHGFPEVMDGARNWQSQSNYDYVSNALAVMGSPFLMNTSPTGGTGWGGYVAGMQTWLDAYYPDAFTVSAQGCSGGWCPGPDLLAFCEASECLVSIGYGRYSFDTCGANPSQFVRTGGHVQSLARVYDYCTSTPEVWVRDPAAHDGVNTTQAPFVTEHTTYTEYTSIFGGGACNPSPIVRTMWRRTTDDPTQYRFLDGYAIVNALEGLTGHAQLGEVSIEGTWSFGSFAVPQARVFRLPTGHEVLDVAYELGSPGAVVLSRSGNEHALWRLDRGTGRAERAHTFSGPVGRLVMGRRHDLYLWQQLATAGGRLIRLDLDSFAMLSALNLAQMPRAMAFDDAQDKLVLVTGDGSALGTADADLGRYMEEDLPAGLLPGSGPCLGAGARVYPDSPYALCLPDQDLIAFLGRGAAGGLQVLHRVAGPGVVEPRNLQITARGTLVFTSDGVVRAMQLNREGGWEPAERFPLAGRAAGDFLRLTDSRINAGDWFNTPSDINIEPDADRDAGVPDCAADFNGDLRVSSQDFFDFLRAFFDGSLPADVNFDGVVNSQDFFDYLAAFFRGCE